jgi:hypothetical protein
VEGGGDVALREALEEAEEEAEEEEAGGLVESLEAALSSLGPPPSPMAGRGSASGGGGGGGGGGPSLEAAVRQQVSAANSTHD